MLAAARWAGDPELELLAPARALSGQRGRQQPRLLDVDAWVCGQHLDVDAVGAGVAVRLDSRRDGVLIAPHDEGVNAAVVATVDEVVVGEPLTLPVFAWFGRFQEPAEVLPGDLASGRGISTTTPCSQLPTGPARRRREPLATTRSMSC
jgi:hypothetical protein